MQRCTEDGRDFAAEFEAAWDCYLPFVRCYGDALSVGFQCVPFFAEDKVSVKPGTHWRQNTVNFVESWQSWLCRLGPLHPGDKFERTFDIPTIELTTSATKSTELLTSCRIQVVADLSPKPRPYRQQSRPYWQQSTLSPVCTRLYSMIQYNRMILHTVKSWWLSLPHRNQNIKLMKHELKITSEH